MKIHRAKRMVGTAHGAHPHNHSEFLELRRLLSSYTYQSVAEFNATPIGQNPSSNIVQNSNGDLFGTTSAGGVYNKGTFFEIAAGSGTVTPLLSFSGSNGSGPIGSLVTDAGGDIFGITQSGGTNQTGVLYELAAGSSTVTTVATFPTTVAAGSVGLTIDQAGNLYGGSRSGVYELPAGGSSIQLLYSFTAQGLNVSSITSDSAGDLFFDTSIVAGSPVSAVYELPTGASQLSLIYGLTTSQSVFGKIVLDSAGDVFATSTAGSTSSLFKLSAPSWTMTPLTTLATSTGGDSASLTIDSSGDLFGVAQAGTVFELPNGQSTAVALSVVPAALGEYTVNSPLIDPNGNIFAAAVYGSGAPNGAVVELGSGSSTVTTTATFNSTAGAVPAGDITADMVEDANGNLFGLTSSGGIYGYGTVFELPKFAAVQVTLASLQDVSGEYGANILTIDQAGDLFGIAPGGTTLSTGFDCGGIFELPAGSSTLHVVVSFPLFSGYGARGVPIFDSAGNMFFTTSDGGPTDDGDILELPKGSSSFVTLANFTAAIGDEPSGSLVMDSAGDLFGTCGNGGPNPFDGVIYELVKGSNTPIDLHTFTLGGIDGDEPYNGLVADSNGILYGATDNGGSQNVGTIYKFDPSSKTLTTLDQLADSALGTQIDSPFIMDSGGNIFVTAIYAASGTGGQVDEITGGSTITKIASVPALGTASGMVLDSTGVLYSTLRSAGAAGEGNIFELIPPTHLAITQQPATAATGTPIATAIDAAIQDTSNSVITSTAAVSLTIASGPTGGILGGTTTASAVDGVAVFPNLTFSAPGYYTLAANSPGILSGDTIPVLVTQAAGSASVSGTVTGGPAGEIVYLDANNNSVLDAGELSAVVHSDGTYSFSGVPSAPYIIRQSLGGGYAQVTPAGSQGISILLSSTSVVINQNFIDAPKLTGTIIGTSGSYLNDGTTSANAFDGNLATYFDGPTNSNDWIGLDLGTSKVITSLGYASRSGWASRMNGGIFQASNSATFASGVANLYTIASNANPSSTNLTTQTITNTTAYRYVRYLAPAKSFGDVAEVQFFGKAPVTLTKFTGTTIGTSGSYKNDGNTIAMATDGSLSTFYDGAAANGNWVGLDLGLAKIVKQISYAPRNGYSSRMVGGIFQASNSATFSSGVVNLYTITTSPTSNVLTNVTVSVTAGYRYYRYLSPNGSEGDIAEVGFYG